MISVSVQDLCLRYFAPNRWEFGHEHPIYVIRDKDTVFYVGCSTNPIGRFYDHMQVSNYSPVGKFIRLHLPWSLAWQVEFLTLDDCRELTERYIERYPMSALVMLYHYNDAAERALIAHHRPCLNVAYNDESSPLPRKYWQYSLPLTAVADGASNCELSDLMRLEPPTADTPQES